MTRQVCAAPSYRPRLARNSMLHGHAPFMRTFALGLHHQICSATMCFSLRLGTARLFSQHSILRFRRGSDLPSRKSTPLAWHHTDQERSSRLSRVGRETNLSLSPAFAKRSLPGAVTCSHASVRLLNVTKPVEVGAFLCLRSTKTSPGERSATASAQDREAEENDYTEDLLDSKFEQREDPKTKLWIASSPPQHRNCRESAPKARAQRSRIEHLLEGPPGIASKPQEMMYHEVPANPAAHNLRLCSFDVGLLLRSFGYSSLFQVPGAYSSEGRGLPS